jgi:UDPglucose 6-dehydrogenase/GDP-mannose 6-dehydrogenase
MKISIIGTGYVGLVTGACLASAGHEVACVDVNPDIVGQINRGETPIFEAGLDEIVRTTVESRKLRATTDTCEAVCGSDVTFICVGTPTGPSGADLSYIISAADSIGVALAVKGSYHVVAVKSTVLPGTTEGIVRSAIEARVKQPVGEAWGLCMTPEFLREGHAVNDFLTPDRVVIGASDRRAGEIVAQVFAGYDCPRVITSVPTAEMTKYVANSLFATMISFSNEVANLCSSTSGINAQDVWKGVHLDRRLTPLTDGPRRPAGLVEYLWHGLGFGGSCFPKDVAAFQGFGKEMDTPTPLLDAVLSTNISQPLRVVSLLEKEMKIHGSTVAILGLSFKPGTDDLRESPAIPVTRALRDRGACVVAHDPVALGRAQADPNFADVTLVQDWSSALKDADACCLITAWPEYREITGHHFRRLMRQPIVVDGRGLYDPSELMRAGVLWRGIGYTPEARPVSMAAL